MLAASRPRVLLLDVDGVVFNHKGLLNKVGNKVVNFVAKELHVEPAEADSINKLLYSQFGHTFTGLKRVYNIPKSSYDFSNFVYDDDLLTSLENVKLDGDLLKNSVDMKYVLSHCKNHDIEVYLFSNAPYVWCKTVVDTMQLSSHINNDQILSSDHDVFQQKLKPDRSVYDTITRYISYKRRDHHIQFTYVDDSFVNLVPVLGDGSWKPIFFNKDGGVTIKNKYIQTIEDLYQLHDMI
jgi:FMN phosphatase YigB (HAD superfamily)